MIPARPGSFRALLRLALIAIAIGVAAHTVFLLLTADRDALRSLAGLDIRYLALALGLTLVPWATNTARTLVWTRFVGLRLTPTEALRIVLVTDLGSAVTPTAAGGNYFKLAMLVERGLAPGTAASLAVLGTLEDGLFFAVAVPAALTISGSWGLPPVRQALQGLLTYWPALIALVVGIPGLAVWLARRRRGAHPAGPGWRARGRKLVADFLAVYRLIATGGKRRLVLTLSLTAIQWTARYTVIAGLFAAMGIPANPITLFVLQWMVFTLGTFVPTPGGAGAVEAAFLLAYDPLVPEGMLTAVAAGWRFLTFYVVLLGAAVLSLLLGALEKARADERGPAVAEAAG
jgi:uncharacterized membrane protein YbhN (UPF0104 family)